MNLNKSRPVVIYVKGERHVIASAIISDDGDDVDFTFHDAQMAEKLEKENPTEASDDDWVI